MWRTPFHMVWYCATNASPLRFRYTKEHRIYICILNLIYTHYPYYISCIFRTHIVPICLTRIFRVSFFAHGGNATNWHLIKKIVYKWLSYPWIEILVSISLIVTVLCVYFFFNLPNGLRSTFSSSFFLLLLMAALFYQMNANEKKMGKNHKKFNIHHIKHIFDHNIKWNIHNQSRDRIHREIFRKSRLYETCFWEWILFSKNKITKWTLCTCG